MSIYYGNKKIAGLYRSEDVTHATEEHAGIIEIATDSEVQAGEDNSKAITAQKLKNELNRSREVAVGGEEPQGVATALWIDTGIPIDTELFPNDYSLDERIVGTFLGKPLYRKVIEKDMAPTQGSSISTGITDGQIVKYNAYCTPSWVQEGVIYSEGWLGSQNMNFYPNTDSSVMVLGSQRTTSDPWFFRVIIEYVKN